MFKTQDEQSKYIVENYPEVTDSCIDDEHWDLLCPHCKVTRGFQVVERSYTTQESRYSTVVIDWTSPITYYFRCPVCKAHKLWIVFKLTSLDLTKPVAERIVTRYFRVTSIPNEGLEEIQELPENPPALRTAYKQAIRAMDANAHLASAAMFRRTPQVITRDVLGAKPGNLANELNEVVGKQFNGVTITSNFANVGYFIKEAGNQDAHPDKDPDLLDLTNEDAEDLQKVFMELVAELFIAPAATKKARADFLARRKIMPKA